jgi:hypothetical protein
MAWLGAKSAAETTQTTAAIDMAQSCIIDGSLRIQTEHEAIPLGEEEQI